MGINYGQGGEGGDSWFQFLKITLREILVDCMSMKSMQ